MPDNLRHYAKRALSGNIEIIDQVNGFVRAIMPYDYRYTCNAQQWDEANRICAALEWGKTDASAG